MSRSAATLLTHAYGVDAAPSRDHPPRRAGPAARRPGHGQAGPRPRRPGRDPELRPARPGQGLRARDRRAAGGRRGASVGAATSSSAPPTRTCSGREGEAYRQALVAQVHRLGLADHVRFVDRFVGRVELTHWLEAADVFVTPYPNLDQIVSGTLSYAMGAGRAIVSTPYAYAAELLADGRGMLVPPGLAGRPGRGARSTSSATTTCARALGPPRLRAQPAAWSGPRSAPSTGACSSGSRQPADDAAPSAVAGGRQCLSRRRSIPSAGCTSTP